MINNNTASDVCWNILCFVSFVDLQQYISGFSVEAVRWLAPINPRDIHDRVLYVLKLYDKINPEKVNT